MNSTIIYAIIFLLVPFGIFFILGWLILYHLKTYGLKGSFSEKARIIFIIGTLAISLLAIQKFVSIEWDSFFPGDITIQDSNINLFPEIYE
jgi:hypothetical protein